MPNSHYKQLLHDRGICVIIPVYNNAGTIADVVERTLLHCDDVIVVNDGSTDSTKECLERIPGITIINSPKNEGKGAALRRGFRKALELGFSYAITIDADGQHYPEDIPLFLEANIKHPGCLIVGSRDLKGVVRSKGSSFANSFSNFWFCVQTLHKLPDTQTGYRLYPLRKLRGLSFLTSRYEAELELLVFASWHGVKLVSKPINVFYPKPEERVSHFRPGLDFTRISILNTVLCILAVVYGIPCFLYRSLKTGLFTVTTYVVYLVGAVTITPIASWKSCYTKLTRKPSSILHNVVTKFSKTVVKLLGLFGSKVSVDNQFGEDFKKPALIICNHQSQLDLMVQLSQTNKIIFLTNDWVWKNPIFGAIVRCAEYYPVSMRLENLIPKLKELVDRGYSISVFPEGTRSETGEINRFHKGIFHIADTLNLDILPLVVYGTGKVMPKYGWLIKKWPIWLQVGKRINQEDLTALGTTLRAQAKNLRGEYQIIYDNLKNRIERNV